MEAINEFRRNSMKESIQKVLDTIYNSTEEMLKLQHLLTAVPAISPESGGEGELKKAEVLANWLTEHSFPEPQWFFAPDQRALEKKRPGLVVSVPGENPERVFWIMSHIDIVPPGELELWDTDPYSATVKDGKIFGRGVEDNQQGIISSIFAVKALLENGITPHHTVKLLFVADEENGSAYGIQHLLAEEDLFGSDDYILVPDGGDPQGKTLEIAEKSTLWLKFRVLGRQGHAARPDQGTNAFLAGSSLVCALAGLAGFFPQSDKLFDPPVSTFVPTKKEANVPNINTLPGEDVFYLDSRILPSIPVDQVLSKIDDLQAETEKRFGVRVERTVVQRTESKPTPPDCGLVGALKEQIKLEYGIDAYPIGIGGGTVGAYLRNRGLETVVWSRLDETAHMPNEYCVIENMVGDARVMARLMMSGCR